ncbi:DUF2384 domain-containing protein [Massilia sp. RP-1-19]|uniref:DUF2384 domain-containing protein n=1 Tax=Massilia polaris TaxID=2728846 RepID=A0A848HTG6_9BURK|nr:antitoxin Xre/MbcA/ParS toxin-binding domain-containing protein [Massilia polaris]NML62593.1 DUF2384 domain-containing protein [Massilia polaris]
MRVKPGPVKLPQNGGQPLAETVKANNAFAELVHELARDRQEAIAAIRAGFSASVLMDAGTYFNVPLKRIQAIVRLPEAAAHTLVKRGAPMDSVASEGLWRLADVTAMAEEVFDDAEAAKTWLRTTNRTFHDTAPMDYLDTEPGAMAVRQVLNAIACGGVL